jgi:hypothetical protein
MDILTLAVPTAIFIVMMIILLFQSVDRASSNFPIILWLGIPFLAMISSLGIHLSYQKCDSINPMSAILGSLYTLGAVWIALAISWIDVCRIPIASVFAPMYMNDTPQVSDSSKNANAKNANAKNANATSCCTPQWTLKAIEDKSSIVSGWCYGFYAFFGVLFGIVTGTATGTAC